MEGDQIREFKHACKFCGKSFPCGRSLGGHMRSHITNLSSEEHEKEKLPPRKLSSSLNNGEDRDSEAATNAGYGLRENPKKTWRISDYSGEDALVFDKLCKECGKGFHSWKALFGHMKCHSEKERASNSLEDQDSWTNASSGQKVVMDSQSDNEATAPNRRRRSKRRTRYTVASAAAASLVVSFANPSSSLSEVEEQEQEEVAMSLMMLSRDVSPWSGPHSVAESSDNNSAYFEAPSSVRTNLVAKFDGNKNFTPNAAKLIKQSDDKWEVGNSENPNSIRGKSSQLLTTITATAEIPEYGFRVNKSGVSHKGYEKAIKSELENVSALEDSEGEHGRSRVNGTESVLSKSATTGNKYSSIKTKFLGSELKSNKNWVDKASEAESGKNSNKRGRFECTTCNKIFHSYQALGGHRASHKKIKGCFASRNESSENSIETDLSPEPATENKLMKNSDNEYLVEHEHVAGLHNEVETVTESKKIKRHECPICFKVFPSGQALGGHKRSHMAGGSESRSFQTIVIQEPEPEIRDFLDLNLPAATEEESNSHADSNRPWWVVEDNHKQEALVGLIS
ncbi:Zinc finger protein ZAT4 [Spatholobus suberectus]|nr:Zinc finger protein ZAT4 [Spatholobus suberectus]